MCALADGITVESYLHPALRLAIADTSGVVPGKLMRIA
jgi:hypothetical protein